MADTGSIQLAVHPDGVAVLTLDQPDSRANLLSKSLWAELEAALLPLADRPDVKGLVVASAKPGVFIAGADLRFLASVQTPNDPAVRDLIEYGLRVLDVLESVPFPTCAAIDGAALGGGLEVALACDYRVAGTNPRVELGLPEVKLGLIPGWGGTQRLPRVLGLERAADLLATGRTVKAEEAKSLGLVRDVVPSDQLLDACVGTVGATAPAHIRAWKRNPVPEADRRSKPAVPSEPNAAREAMLCLVRGVELPLADALALETEAFLRLAGSDESRQLIGEFFASKKK
ncbi:MAG TPA: enoyl-CoA hydratase-related protein [Fimbriiglobus sp.]|nr:enoyl-CoA hydratase-related protein [Fimbriiglobus sp.]